MPEQSTLKQPTYLDLRTQLHQMVVNDLLGPAGGPEEIITEQRVSDRYILGLLAPKGQTPLPAEEDEDLSFDGMDGEDGKSEPVNVQRHTMRPSSMGMTFTVDAEASEIVVNVKWGHYVRVSSTELDIELDKPRYVWKRQQIEVQVNQSQ